jgi:hypothetical protein
VLVTVAVAIISRTAVVVYEGDITALISGHFAATVVTAKIRTVVAVTSIKGWKCLSLNGIKKVAIVISSSNTRNVAIGQGNTLNDYTSANINVCLG